jgi:hypothetical protein
MSMRTSLFTMSDGDRDIARGVETDRIAVTCDFVKLLEYDLPFEGGVEQAYDDGCRDCCE